MIKGQEGVSALNKLQISTKEVISYLESVNLLNDEILKVLQKKPSLPDYDKLPWVLESKMDRDITIKLKNKKNLNAEETTRLKETLIRALSTLKKGHSTSSANKRTNSLQSYINKLG
jgi:hypothetical protein